MTAPVDVRAILGRCATHYQHCHNIGSAGKGTAARIEEARARFDELIASATEAAKQLRAMGETGHSAHLTHAIANAKGGAK